MLRFLTLFVFLININKRATVNIINCTVDKWDARSEWAGFLIMQDYTSGSVEAEETNNLFAPVKLTINFINVVGTRW